jgi:hypothetical protein
MEATSSPSPYPFWIHLHCLHCGKEIDAGEIFYSLTNRCTGRMYAHVNLSSSTLAGEAGNKYR